MSRFLSTRGCIPAFLWAITGHMTPQADTPPHKFLRDTVNKRAVCILLECILVFFFLQTLKIYYAIVSVVFVMVSTGQTKTQFSLTLPTFLAFCIKLLIWKSHLREILDLLIDICHGLPDLPTITSLVLGKPLGQYLVFHRDCN